MRGEIRREVLETGDGAALDCERPELSHGEFTVSKILPPKDAHKAVSIVSDPVPLDLPADAEVGSLLCFSTSSTSGGRCK